MADISINEMQEMQKTLQEKYKHKWESISPEIGQNKLLWMIGEIGEVIDIVKKNGGERAIESILPVLDDFERALSNMAKDKNAAEVMTGVELIYNKLMGYLKGKGLSVIEAKDKELDTEFHEAVAQFPVEDKSKKNKIIDVVQQGYMLNGKVIRYAKVVVAM